MSNLKVVAIKGVIWSLFDKLINQVGNFVLLIYLSNILSPADFGMIAMLAIFLAIAQSLIDSGFSQALVQKSHKVTEIDLSTVFYVNLGVSVLLYCLLFVLAPAIANFFHQPELVDLSRALFIVVIINALALVPRAKLMIAVDFKSQGLINSASMIISAAVTIYMINVGYGYWSLVAMNLVKSLISALLLMLFSRWRPKWLFSTESFSKLFSFGSNLLIAGLLATTVQNLYSILIGRHFNALQLGYFQQGFNYTNILSSTLSSVVQGVTYPIMTSIQQDEERLVKVYVRVMSIVTLVTFPVFVGFAAISEEFVKIFLGDKWIPIIPILFILSFARLITPISSLNLNILNARGRSDLFLKTDLCKLPMTIVALFIAAPYGIVAVAVSQLIIVIISFFINAYYPGKLFGYGAIAQLRQILPIALATLIMYAVINQIKLDSLWLQLVLKIVLGMFIYCGSCWILKVKALEDIKDIIQRK
ncbi:lipopolysaccharide biosynthesis protein [Shewanella sp. 10N.286.54.B9]|uniref:lipopolysaccharide biosynthesis protein n=1 Tax=Shewanella sp. 10N.286.54.B9 TaxID=3229719 RepID=UPI0035507AE3